MRNYDFSKPKLHDYDFYLNVSPLKNETLRKLTPSRK